MQHSETLGERIRRLRGSETQDDVAAEVGISRPALNKIENGKTPQPHNSTLKRIAAYFGVTENYLRTGSDLVPLPKSAGEGRNTSATDNDSKMVADSELTPEDRAAFYKGRYEEAQRTIEAHEIREAFYQEMLLKKHKGNLITAAAEPEATYTPIDTPESRVVVQGWGRKPECVVRIMYPVLESAEVTPSYAYN